MADAPPPAETPSPNGDAAPADAPAPPDAVKPAAPPTKVPRPWQGGRFNPTARRSGNWDRWRTIFILLAVILGLGGAVAAWVMYPGSIPHPHFEAVALDQYTDPRVPVSRWTAEDRAALSARGWQESNAFTSQQRNLLVEELHSLGKNQPTNQPLVVYLCAYALPTKDGGLAVLPGDAALDDENTWLPLTEVFKLLKDSPAKRKLLLLDVMKPFTDARAGALADDAADRAEPIVRKAVEDDRNLLVLSSCSPGQTSLASEEMGHTVFVHYLIEGLAGKADGWGGGILDNRVTARELAAFVTANVDHWAAHNRGARQTPTLLGPADLDVPLTVADANPAAAETPLDKAYPQGLREAWELRDRWKADQRFQTPPALYRELEDAALHAEDRWRGGADAVEVQADLKRQVAGVEKRHNELPGATAHGEPRSLARAVAEGRKPPGKLEDAFFQLGLLAKLQQRAGATPPDAEAATQLETRRKAFLKDYEDKPFDLAWTVFQAARQHPETRPEALRVWLDLLKPEGKPGPDYAEIHFLEALAALEVKDAAADWPAVVVGAALELANEAEQTRAELELGAPVATPALADWLRKWADEADDQRQKAQDLFLSAKPADRAKAAAPLDAAVAGDRGYRALREAVRVLRSASRCRDDALVLLPGYTDYLVHAPGREGDWKNASSLTRELRDRLAKPPAEGPSADWFRDTDARAKDLRKNLDNLLQPLDSGRLHSLIAQSPRSTAADAEDMRALLRLPALPAADRLAVWSALRDLAERLHQESPALEKGGGGAESLSPPDADKAKHEERARALLRARTSLALLKLEGVGDPATVEKDVQKAAQNPADDAALWQMSQDLRACWKGRAGTQPR